MEALLSQFTLETKEEVKRYLAEKEIPQLFESIATGLLYNRPSDPAQFVQDCLAIVRRGDCDIRWNTFLDLLNPPKRPIVTRDG
ncbi:hypothetical protein NP493_924g02061 [Ridgeia piscesae]|uniref:Uncharacterized protein n=1 Tax=Ridgeia piscesae TaxID=27915 RepID=A0AAD9KK37_RIDPI|nr:hypothetical protein NP493_924g02061 [Ridgeia piscesae]